MLRISTNWATSTTSTYLRWVQDAAVAHWRAAAPPADQARLVWVVLRHEIDYKQAAYAGDQVIARTWVGTLPACASNATPKSSARLIEACSPKPSRHGAPSTPAPAGPRR